MENNKILFQNALADAEAKIARYCSSYPRSFGELLQNDIGSVFVFVGIFLTLSVCFTLSNTTISMFFAGPACIFFGIVMNVKTKAHRNMLNSDEVYASIESVRSTARGYSDVESYCNESISYVKNKESQKESFLKKKKIFNYVMIFLAFTPLLYMCFNLESHTLLLQNFSLKYNYDYSIKSFDDNTQALDIQFCTNVGAEKDGIDYMRIMDFTAKDCSSSDCIISFVDTLGVAIPYAPTFYLAESINAKSEGSDMHFHNCLSTPLSNGYMYKISLYAKFLRHIYDGNIRYKVIK